MWKSKNKYEAFIVRPLFYLAGTVRLVFCGRGIFVKEVCAESKSEFPDFNDGSLYVWRFVLAAGLNAKKSIINRRHHLVSLEPFGDRGHRRNNFQRKVKLGWYCRNTYGNHFYNIIINRIILSKVNSFLRSKGFLAALGMTPESVYEQTTSAKKEIL